jgi:hypothetical protein
VSVRDHDDDELRVGEVLRSDSPEEVDPDLVASLHSWFDGPALGMDQLLGERDGAVEEESEESEEEDEPPAEERRFGRGGITMNDINPELHAHVLGWADRGKALLTWSQKRMHLSIEDDPSQLDVVESADPDEEREYPIPWYMQAAMAQNTPQSLLRDLARYEIDLSDRIVFEEHQMPIAGLGQVQSENKATMTASYRQLISRAPLNLELMDEAWADLRAILDAPWEDSKPEQARRQISYEEYLALEAKLMRGEL